MHEFVVNFILTFNGAPFVFVAAGAVAALVMAVGFLAMMLPVLLGGVAGILLNLVALAIYEFNRLVCRVFPKKESKK